MDSTGQGSRRPGQQAPPGTWDVFLAYAGPDRARARDLHEALRSHGVRVCFDQAVLQPGDDWHLLLPSYVRASAIVVVLVSPRTAAAHYQRSEVITAVDIVRRENRRLVPVRLTPDASLPYGTEQLQAIDMLDGADVPEVARRIAALVPEPDVRRGGHADQVLCERVPLVSRFFTGRESLLARLADSLRPGTTAVVTQAIQGLGGVGKTTAAAAFADSRRDDVDVVWWVRAEEPATLVSDLAELAPHVGAPTLDDLVRTAVLVRQRLEATDRSWLVVFDNVPDHRTVEEWIPRRGRGAVLITSRSTSFPAADEVIRVDTFPPEVAERFLRDRVRRDNPEASREDLGPVVERLGGLPLALEQAGAWVAQVPNRRYARFVELYDDAARDPFPDGTRPVDYDHTATTSWRLSLRAAAAEAPLAKRVACVLSYFAPDRLPCQWLRDMADDEYFAATDTEGDAHADVAADAIGEALDALHLYSLATIAPDDTVSVHRVIQAVARRSAQPGAAQAAIRTLWRKCTDDPFAHYSEWQTLAQVAPHALAVADTAGDALADSARELCSLLVSVSRYQAHNGQVRGSLATATRACALANAHLGPDQRETLESRECIASAFHTAGDVVRAIPLYVEVLADATRVLGPDHPSTLNIRNDLAAAYRTAGDPERSIVLQEAAVADYRRALGIDHPHTLAARNNLGHVLIEAGDVDRALHLLQEVLADKRQLFAPDHPEMLITRNNIARAHLAAGDVANAISGLDAVLIDRRHVLGDDHPATLISRNDLARAHLAAGDVANAISGFDAVLIDRRRVLGDDHPETLITRSHLSEAHLAAGDTARGLAELEATFADCRRILGDVHHLTISTREAVEQARSDAEDP